MNCFNRHFFLNSGCPLVRHLLFVIFFLLAATIIQVDAQDRFIDNGDGTVTDQKLNLMWASEDNGSDILWRQAKLWLKQTYQKQINSRYQDWRLPTIMELQSLVVEDPEFEGYVSDCGFRVKIDPRFRISCTLIWSSETALGLPLLFNFSLGNAFAADLNDQKGCRVLPVRPIK